MRIDIISAVPELLNGVFSYSIIKKAADKGIASIHIHDLREYGKGKHKQIDDYPFGGEPGMVLMIEPIYKIINKLKSERNYDSIIYTSPDGAKWNQKTANKFSLKKNLIILCGHYKGVDQRVRDHLITEEYSIGDFVLTGGEIAAAAFCDSIIRLIPGAIGDEQSALNDSFQDDLLSYPVYTRPAVFNNWEVPKVLLSGHFAKIEEWKEEQSILKTKQMRPDLLKP